MERKIFHSFKYSVREARLLSEHTGAPLEGFLPRPPEGGEQHPENVIGDPRGANLARAAGGKIGRTEHLIAAQTGSPEPPPAVRTAIALFDNYSDSGNRLFTPIHTHFTHQPPLTCNATLEALTPANAQILEKRLQAFIKTANEGTIVIPPGQPTQRQITGIGVARVSLLIDILKAGAIRSPVQLAEIAKQNADAAKVEKQAEAKQKETTENERQRIVKRLGNFVATSENGPFILRTENATVISLDPDTYRLTFEAGTPALRKTLQERMERFRKTAPNSQIQATENRYTISPLNGERIEQLLRILEEPLITAPVQAAEDVKKKAAMEKIGKQNEQPAKETAAEKAVRDRRMIALEQLGGTLNTIIQVSGQERTTRLPGFDAAIAANGPIQRAIENLTEAQRRLVTDGRMWIRIEDRSRGVQYDGNNYRNYISIGVNQNAQEILKTIVDGLAQVGESNLSDQAMENAARTRCLRMVRGRASLPSEERALRAAVGPQGTIRQAIADLTPQQREQLQTVSITLINATVDTEGLTYNRRSRWISIDFHQSSAHIRDVIARTLAELNQGPN